MPSFIGKRLPVTIGVMRLADIRYAQDDMKESGFTVGEASLRASAIDAWSHGASREAEFPAYKAKPAVGCSLSRFQGCG